MYTVLVFQYMLCIAVMHEKYFGAKVIVYNTGR